MNKTRRFGSPKLNIGYVTDELVEDKPIPLVDRLVAHGNAVRVASAADIKEGVWRLYRPSVSGAGAAFPECNKDDGTLIGSLDAVLFDHDSFGVTSGVSMLDIATRKYQAERIDLRRFSRDHPGRAGRADTLALAIEDHLYRDVHRYSPF